MHFPTINFFHFWIIDLKLTSINKEMQRTERELRDELSGTLNI